MASGDTRASALSFCSPPVQVLAVEMVPVLTTPQLAAMARNQIAEVRRLPGMRHARAIVICESNNNLIADTLAEYLRTTYAISNMLFMHLDAVFSRHHQSATPNAQGEIPAGLYTSEKHKITIMELADRMFREHRFYRHQAMVCYATRQRDQEEALLHDWHNNVPEMRAHFAAQIARYRATAVQASDLALLPTYRPDADGDEATGHSDEVEVYKAEAADRIGHLYAQQWKNMVRSGPGRLLSVLIRDDRCARCTASGAAPVPATTLCTL